MKIYEKSYARIEKYDEVTVFNHPMLFTKNKIVDKYEVFRNEKLYVYEVGFNKFFNKDWFKIADKIDHNFFGTLISNVPVNELAPNECKTYYGFRVNKNTSWRFEGVKNYISGYIKYVLSCKNTQMRISLDKFANQIFWIYFNPDAGFYGQYVEGYIPFEYFKEIVDEHKGEDELAQLIECESFQILSDYGTPDFAQARHEYEACYDFVEFTDENIREIYRIIKNHDSEVR